MAHLLSKQVFDHADLGDLIGPSDTHAPDLLLSQQLIG